jgi:hypothetical protein
MGNSSHRSAFRLGSSALGVIGALIATSSVALAHNNPPPPVTAFDDIGIGYLNGPDPDANKAKIAFETNVEDGKVKTKASVQYRKDADDGDVGGDAFNLTQYDHVTGTTSKQGHGHDDDSGKSGNYVDSFTFDLNSTSSVIFKPGREDDRGHGSEHSDNAFNGTITLVKGVLGSKDAVVSYETGTKGPHDSLIFANLGAGEYSLVFQGVVGGNNCGEGSNSYGGTISAVPLPGSIAMFAPALLGLTGFAASRRKKKTV